MAKYEYSQENPIAEQQNIGKINEIGNDPRYIFLTKGIGYHKNYLRSFEEALRHGFKIYSARLLGELNTFVYINGRPDHMKGHHDDLIMSVAMALYVGQSSYNQLEKVTEQTKAMLNSWEVQSNGDKQKSITDFNPGIPVLPSSGYNTKQFNTEPNRSDYQKYLWLFGK